MEERQGVGSGLFVEQIYLRTHYRLLGNVVRQEYKLKLRTLLCSIFCPAMYFVGKIEIHSF